MSDTKLPDPLVPAEVDLRGLEYMPLLGARLFSSDFALEASDSEFRAGLRLWWEAWNQVPAASLPTSDKALCGLAGCGDNVAKWRKLKQRALHGFQLCSDGRLYHGILAAQALIAWEKRAEHVAERQNEAERKRRDRAERAVMFEQLRAVGIVPAWDIKKSDLRALHEEHVTRTVTRTSPPPVTVTGAPPVTRTVTAKTGRDGTGQEENQGRASASADARDPDPEPQQPTPAGAACRAMRQAGMQAVNPGDPRLLELLRQGATVDEFAGTAAEAVSKGKGFAWVLTVVQARRAEAAEIALAPPVELTPPSRDIERSQQWLREHSTPLTPEEKAKADEARKRVMAAVNRSAA